MRELLENFVELPFVEKSKVDIDAIVNQTGGCFHDFRRNTRPCAGLPVAVE